MQIYIPNSEIRIPTYKPKYIIGDIIYMPNRNNKTGIYLKILRFTILFSEFRIINGVAETPYIVDLSYTGQIMLGSNHDVKIIPPGKALVGYWAIDMLDADLRAEFVAHKQEDYVLFDRKMPMAFIDAIYENLEKQAIETNGLT